MRDGFGRQVKLIRHRLSTGKHPTRKLMGFARRNRGNGTTNLTFLIRAFPTYREELERRPDPELRKLIQRLEGKYDRQVNAHFAG